MAKLFNKQILKRHIQKHSIPDEKNKIERIARWKRNLKLNRNVKEEALQAAFLKGIFGTILGYKDLTEAEDKQYTMKVEPATEVDATKPDGSLGFFEINGAEQTKVVIELKGPKISLDEKQKRAGKDYGTPVEQAFGYATKYDGIEWVIVSNMIEIRLYKYDRGQGHYEEFLIPRLDDPENFKEFHLILSRPNLFTRENGSLTEKLTRETAELEEDITTKFYNLYKQTRIELFEHLKQHNPDYDQELLFEKAQKFLDRIIFICFCEDLGLLPPKILHKAIQSGEASFSMSDTRIWEEIKGIFKAIDQGNPAKNINAYNGGLFKPDETLHQLTIKNNFFSAIDEISAYDFDSDLDVNILGHIFEQSISDIEEIKADIQAEEYNQQESKRKKEGIFYTPEYITKYIVENSVGKYIEDIKTELGYAELPEIDAAESPQVKGKYRQKHLRFYDEYIQRLRSIKILDPACGSGAFLNQAFDYLLQEYKWVRNQRSLIEQKPIDISLQDQVFKQILQDNLYGVDLNQESVEITKLSLWLKSANKNKPLANLDDNIKCGNSLIDDPEVAGDKAFDWEAEFPEIMDAGGFDVVIGNPPYIRTQYLLSEDKNYFSQNYNSAEYGGYDIYSIFVEKGYSLLSKNGY
ncbi:MAG TPA: DNA methyltransferase, partial [bacterium]|nr:DNA methyltransferase [bacterium]